MDILAPYYYQYLPYNGVLRPEITAVLTVYSNYLADYIL